MEGLSYEMSSSSLVGPMGTDFRQLKSRDHRKLTFNYIVDCQRHRRLSLPGGRHSHTGQPPCCVIKGMISSSSRARESEIRPMLDHKRSACLASPPPCSKWQVLSGIITNLFVSKSQLPFFKISPSSLPLPACSRLSRHVAGSVAFDRREAAVT